MPTRPRSHARALPCRADTSSRPRVSIAIDLCGRTGLGDLVPLGRACLLAIGNDTGPMHWIAAAGAPVLALFSSESDPALCAPRGRAARFLRRPDLASLAVEDVEAAATGLLEAAARLSPGEALPASP